ncbi:hypothetical protein SUGI_0018840 [Cryptomeria japonica]|nr:hypothetical protein SUGI_0018840 [Cryptomeria japonica]
MSKLLGEGTFGKVYGGFLPDKREVVVKFLVHQERKEWSDFETEMKAIGKEEINWFYECLEHDTLDELVKYQHGPDVTIELSEGKRMVSVGLCCIQDNPDLRPSINKVVQMIEGALDIPAPIRPVSPEPLPINGVLDKS